MMRRMVLVMGMLCFYAGLARAQSAPPTACPTDYTCSYQSSSTQALLGGSTDGDQGLSGALTRCGKNDFRTPAKRLSRARADGSRGSP